MTPTPSTDRFWAVIPAAGSGSHISTTLPKQKHTQSGQPLLTHTVTRLAGHPLIQGEMVVLAADDQHFHKLPFSAKRRLFTTTGGAERCHSVLSGLRAHGPC